ncbi:MAG: hypothetical protein AB7F86_08260 [Bdellovibrionales bacterium]
MIGWRGSVLFIVMGLIGISQNCARNHVVIGGTEDQKSTGVESLNTRAMPSDENKLAQCAGDSSSPVESISVHFEGGYMFGLKYRSGLLSVESEGGLFYSDSTNLLNLSEHVTDNLILLSMFMPIERRSIEVATLFNGVPQTFILPCQ